MKIESECPDVLSSREKVQQRGTGHACQTCRLLSSTWDRKCTALSEVLRARSRLSDSATVGCLFEWEAGRSGGREVMYEITLCSSPNSEQLATLSRFVLHQVFFLFKRSSHIKTCYSPRLTFGIPFYHGIGEHACIRIIKQL